MIYLIIPTLGTRETEMLRLLESLKKQTYSEFKLIVVSQDNHEIVSDILSNYNNLSIDHIKMDSRGLSRARNKGIEYIGKKGIVTFSDDDCWYPNDAMKSVKDYFETNSNTDIVCFQIFDPNKEEYYKNYPITSTSRIGFYSLFKKSSIEIFVNLNNVDISKFQFDENFGMGTVYPSGEENIFLTDLYKSGKTIGYQPSVIVYHKKKEDISMLENRSIISKGPLFKRIFNTPKGLLYLTLFFIKKYKLIHSPMLTYIKTVRETISFRK